MIFESVTHANHYAKGSKLEIVIIDDQVINVTQFKFSHPGGEESIEKYIGKDCTEMYYSVNSHKTYTAIKELKNFSIGTIKTDNTKKPIHNDVQETDRPYPIDLKKGTIYQVFQKLSKEEYLAFIHDPKHMIDPPDAVMFDSRYLEFFTKTPWYAIPIIWIPFVVYKLYCAYFVEYLALSQILICFVIGIFLWTLMEYCLHRFVFHLDENLPNSSYAFLLHYLLHGIHHAFPMDRFRLVFPPAAAIPLVMLFNRLFIFLFDDFASAFFAGAMAGYIGYDLTHYFIHHINPPFDYHKFLKKYHVMHHYKDPHLGYGVSNHFWDVVFGTLLLGVDSPKTSSK